MMNPKSLSFSLFNLYLLCTSSRLHLFLWEWFVFIQADWLSLQEEWLQAFL